MNAIPENYVLPDPDYRGPLFGPDWTPGSNKLTAAEELDLKCSYMDYQNSWYR